MKPSRWTKLDVLSGLAALLLALAGLTMQWLRATPAPPAPIETEAPADTLSAPDPEPTRRWLADTLESSEGVRLLAAPSLVNAEAEPDSAQRWRFKLEAQVRHEGHWQAALARLHETPGGWTIPRECALRRLETTEIVSASSGRQPLHATCLIDWIAAPEHAE
jgi:hypothetical protein